MQKDSLRYILLLGLDVVSVLVFVLVLCDMCPLPILVVCPLILALGTAFLLVPDLQELLNVPALSEAPQERKS